MGTKIPHSILVHFYLLLKLKFISENDNGIEFKIQRQKNHGTEWNVEFLIPKQTSYMHFADFWV